MYVVQKKKQRPIHTDAAERRNVASEDADLAFRSEDLLLDDDNLLRDRLLRSLHRNKDGHLAVAANRHEQGIEAVHNMAVLFCYTLDDGEYTMHEHYVFAPDTRGYKKWREIAKREAEALHKHSGDNFHGVYGWSTAYVKITPLRNGDLFININADGANGVRLTFGAKADEHETFKKKKRNAK